MIDQQIEIPTKDGHTTTFISHPERGGPFALHSKPPGVRGLRTWRRSSPKGAK